MKALLSVIALMLVSSAAFAAETLTIGDTRTLTYCGGTVTVNNGGNDNQVNVVFSGVDSCKWLRVNGSEKELQGQSGNFYGSFTVANASQLTPGYDYETSLYLRARDGTPFENITVKFRVNRPTSYYWPY